MLLPKNNQVGETKILPKVSCVSIRWRFFVSSYGVQWLKFGKIPDRSHIWPQKSDKREAKVKASCAVGELFLTTLSLEKLNITSRMHHCNFGQRERTISWPINDTTVYIEAKQSVSRPQGYSKRVHYSVISSLFSIFMSNLFHLVLLRPPRQHGIWVNNTAGLNSFQQEAIWQSYDKQFFDAFETVMAVQRFDKFGCRLKTNATYQYQVQWANVFYDESHEARTSICLTITQLQLLPGTSHIWFMTGTLFETFSDDIESYVQVLAKNFWSSDSQLINCNQNPVAVHACTSSISCKSSKRNTSKTIRRTEPGLTLLIVHSLQERIDPQTTYRLDFPPFWLNCASSRVSGSIWKRW